MPYSVLLTPDAKNDVDVDVSYIAEVIGMRSSADMLLDDMQKLIETLRVSPKAHEVVRDEFLAARGYRKTVLGANMVLYLVDADRSEVVITHVVHGSRDYTRYVESRAPNVASAKLWAKSRRQIGSRHHAQIVTVLFRSRVNLFRDVSKLGGGGTPIP